MMTKHDLLRVSFFAASISLVAFQSALAASSSYTYDNLNRLNSATIDGSRIEYTYDSAGNITRVITPYSVSVSKAGPGAGTVSDDWAKVDCRDDCAGAYDLNTVVTLTAVPGPGSTFSGWSGACSGGGACVVTVTGAISVEAAFTMDSADLEITKTDGLTTAIPGEAIDYTIVVSNAGPGAVPDASISDVFPAETTCTWTSVSSGGATGSAGSGGGDISESLVLPAASNVTYTVGCQIDPTATGLISNTASVTTAIPDPNPGNESATDVTNLAPSADHWLSMSASPTELGPGQTTTYTMLVGNQGPSQAVSPEVQHILPASAVFVSYNGVDWVCAESSGTVTCTRASMAPAASSSIDVLAEMPTTAGVSSSSAAVSSATPEHAPGDESDSVDVEVFGPPAIVNVGSVSTVEGGSLVPGASTLASLTQIHLEASHGLYDPGGDTDPNDVTNPDCYRIFRAAPDGTFGSTTCGDPTDVAIGPISYEDAGPFTAALSINAGVPLESGLYRLVACASGTEFLMDDYGSALDGDGDGTAGDDFELDFGVVVTNLLANPNFDYSLDGWDVVSQVAGDVIHDATNDTGGALTSGSALLTNLTGAGSILEISQCVVVADDSAYVVAGDVASDSSGATFPEIQAQAEFFDDSICAGTSLALLPMSSITGTSGSAWLPGWNELVAPPPGAASARVTFRVSGNEHSAQAWLDDLQLYFYGIYIFIDGFESGDPSRWDGSS
jgi:uncharacterized repeat protein (TIGR01451 family)